MPNKLNPLEFVKLYLWKIAGQRTVEQWGAKKRMGLNYVTTSGVQNQQNRQRCVLFGLHPDQQASGTLLFGRTLL